MTDSSSNILLLAGDGELRRSMSLLLDGHGYHVDAREPANDALTSIKRHPKMRIAETMGASEVMIGTTSRDGARTRHLPSRGP